MYQKIVKSAAFILLILSIVCESKAQETVKYEKDEFISVNPDVIVDSLEIRIINRWKDFLVTKNYDIEKNRYWVAEDFQKFKYPYRDIYGIEGKNNNDYFYKPTVLEILPTENDYTYLIKTAFIGEDKSVKCIYNVLAQRDSTKGAPVFFKSIRDYNTRDWQRKTVGNIQYIINP